MRHWAECNNAELPGGRVPLLVDGQAAGWVRPGLLPVLLGLGAEGDAAAVRVPGGALQDVARGLAGAGLCRWRGEAFDVRAEPEGPVLGVLDRGALPALGVRAGGVHLNALVRRAGGAHLWVARRAMDKLLDPGKLDHLVAGGIPAGYSPAEALVKEADEEAGLGAALVAGAHLAEVIDYAMERDEGLRRDRLYCYDLDVPETFVPEARDGEVAGFELWPLKRALDRVRRTDDFKFNVNLVLIGLFRREGLLG